MKLLSIKLILLYNRRTEALVGIKKAVIIRTATRGTDLMPEM